MFFEIEIGETTTVGDLLEDWLDVKLAGMIIDNAYPYHIRICDTIIPGLKYLWGFSPLPVSEECLHLAVYTPKTPSEAGEIGDADLLPIMFFVHGGGFTSGFQLQMDAARLGEVCQISKLDPFLLKSHR